MPLHVTEETVVFRTPKGAPINGRNFYQREWLPMLRRLGIRARPFYNTRHTYISTLLSLGAKIAYVCAQTGTSSAMIEKHYGRYFPQSGDDALIENALARRLNVKPNVKPSEPVNLELGRLPEDSVGESGTSERATHRSRTDDLLITNQSPVFFAQLH